MGNLFDTLLIHPITNLLLALYHVLLALQVPYALGFAIILLTVVIRFLLYPLTSSQLKASKKMQQVAPHVNRLKEMHKGDAQRLQQETMKLYKDFGINPAAGCLPVLVQLPIIWALYGVLQKVVSLKPDETLKVVNSIAYFPSLKLEKLWDTTFFGLPIGQNPSQLLQSVGVLILLVPILTGVFQFIQSKMMFPAQKSENSDDKNLPKKEKPAAKSDDFAKAIQTQSTYILPIMIGYFSYQFPLGLSLYWNTFTIFGIIQQYLMERREKDTGIALPLAPVKEPKKKKRHYGKR